MDLMIHDPLTPQRPKTTPLDSHTNLIVAGEEPLAKSFKQ